MEISFRSSDMEKFLDIKLGTFDALRQTPLKYKTKMIENNNIPYMLSPIVEEIDNNLCTIYKIGGYYILDRALYKIKLDGEFLRIIMSQICECISSMEKYLLNADDLILKPEYILYQPVVKDIRLIYIPEYKKDIREQLKRLLEHLMRRFDHHDQAGLVYMYAIYELICDEQSTMEQFKQAVTQSIKECKPKKKEIKQNRCVIKELMPLSNGALDVLPLDKMSESVIVGRGKKESDYRINTTQISRIHARIFRQGDNLMLEDTGSTNGTFLNSLRLPKGEAKTLKPGDVIAFANEEFFVK